MSGLSEEARDIARDTARLRWPTYQAVMLDDLQKTLLHQREVARASHEAHGLAVPTEEADDMIHVGDQITIQQPSASLPAVVPQASSLAAKVAPWVLGPAGGVAAALGAQWLASDAAPEPPAPVVQPAEGQWMEYDIEPWKPGQEP